MEGIVTSLQNRIISQECNAVTLLRRAHIIASKLELKEFDQWISYELNGYPNPGICPDYRKVKGILAANEGPYGFKPVIIPYPEIEDAICEQRFTHPLSEILSLCKDSGDRLAVELPGEVIALMIHALSCPQKSYVVQVSSSSVKDIAERVENILLDWTIKLEKAGIFGEGMQFSDEEKQTSKNIPQTINNYNITSNSSEDTHIFFGDENVNFSYGEANKLILELETIINGLNNKDKDIVLEKLSVIKDKVSQKKKATVIRELLVDLKKLLLNAGNIVLVTLIQISIQHLFLH